MTLDDVRAERARVRNALASLREYDDRLAEAERYLTVLSRIPGMEGVHWDSDRVRGRHGELWDCAICGGEE